MNILICGASGFIGRHLADRLASAGHRVIRGGRSAGGPDGIAGIAIDYLHAPRPESLAPLLVGIDAVINAVGILSEQGSATFEAVHRDGPIALFEACRQAGVKRVVQISAAGGTGKELTPYMRTKREADAALMAMQLDWIILRPSLVVGADGASSRLFRMMASLPVVGLPGRGEQQLQPVHIDDLCDAALRALEQDVPARQVLDVVGPAPMSYRGMLAAYRRTMEMGPPLWLPVPMALMRIAAIIAEKLPQRVLSSDTLRMLEEGNVADPAPLTHLLGRAPAGPDAWLRGWPPGMLRSEALLGWSIPLLRIALALVWIITGILSLGIYPVDQSLTLLARVGLRGAMADAALYGAALLDLGFGMATLLAPGRLLWRLQALLIIGYTAIITLFLPEYWLHPFGPVLKNLPILAILIILDAHDSRKSKSRGRI